MATQRTKRGRRCRLRFRTLIRWLHYYESDPVTPDEYLLRAVPNTIAYIKQSMGRWAIDPYAFKPSKTRDQDGLSLFREDFTTPAAVAQACKHPDGARVVRLSVAAIQSLGLRIQVTPDQTELAGHVILPDMNYIANRSKENKRKIDNLTQELAQLASKEQFYSPPGMAWPVSAPR